MNCQRSICISGCLDSFKTYEVKLTTGFFDYIFLSVGSEPNAAALWKSFTLLDRRSLILGGRLWKTCGKPAISVEKLSAPWGKPLKSAIALFDLDNRKIFQG